MYHALQSMHIRQLLLHSFSGYKSRLSLEHPKQVPINAKSNLNPQAPMHSLLAKLKL